MKDLTIIGAGGHGRVLENIAITMNKWCNIYFLDDDAQKKDKQIIGTVMDYPKYIASCDFIVGIGNNLVRDKFQNILESKGVTFAKIIHPFTSIGTNVEIGNGSVIMPGVVINCNTSINRGCIINTGSTIDHDCTVDDFVHISPGVVLGGSVRIKTRSWIGLGSRIINNISVTSDCIIGAGAVVLRDILDPGTYVGVPATKL